MRSRESTRVRKRAAMLLHQIERGTYFNHRLLRRFISLASGMRFRGAARIDLQKKAVLGASLGAWTQSAMRGPSAWSIAERELMAAAAAQWNACALCTDVLGAAAARHTGRAVVDAVLSDYRSAPISEGLKATLEFLEIMTLRPRSVTEEHVSAVIESGISMETLTDAIEVAVVLKLITRYAGALDFAAQNTTSLTGQPNRWPNTAGGRDLTVP
jgi:AhpD family alkylhydroperoxidase